MSAFAIAAQVYARHGLHVFPLKPRSKEPATPHGFKDATTDPHEIARLAANYPSANIGIACAASNLVTLDTDDRNDGSFTLDELQSQLGALPDSWAVCTPGGMHRHFRAAEGIRFRGMLGPGIDVKHQGYVVAPPSVHPSARLYTWEVSSRFDEVPLAELPASWLGAMTERPQRSALASTGTDASDSLLGRCFEAMGWLGASLADGRRCVRCPWAEEHSDGRGFGEDSSTVIFPRAEGRVIGGFRCAHGHCASRTWRDVLNAMPLDVQTKASRAVLPLSGESVRDRSTRYGIAAVARAAARIEQSGSQIASVVREEATSLRRLVARDQLRIDLAQRALLDAARAGGLPESEVAGAIAQAFGRAS